MGLFLKKWVHICKKSFIQEIDDEEITQNFLAGFFALVGAIIAFLASVNSLLIGLYILSLILFSLSIVFFTAHRILNDIRYDKYHVFIRCLSVLSLFFLGLYLIQSGGVNKSGPLWIYIIPSVAFAFLGLKYGVIVNTVFGFLASIMLFVFEDDLLDIVYSYEFKTRLIYVFMTIVALSAVYEIARHYSFLRLKLMKEKYEYQAQIDYLTLLPNRRGIQKILNEDFQQYRVDGHVTTVASLDIDKFKVVNDVYGHEIGDMVLKHISSVLKKCIRDQDRLARWGGEEFLLVMPDTRQENAKEVLESLRECVQKTPFIYGDINIGITMSVGVCETSSSISFKDAIRLSDVSLYQAKKSGRNAVFFYSSFDGSNT